MESDDKVNIFSLEIDHEAEAWTESQTESTLSNSLEFGVTAESSGCDTVSKLAECVGWTNEKHNSYLDYLENSFVSQLYSLLGGETQRLSTNRNVQSNSYRSTDRFTVIQNGCWQKVNSGKKQSHLETSSEFRFQKKSLGNNPENPNENYTIGTAVQGSVLCEEETKHSGDKAFARSSSRNYVGHKYPAEITAEASGQNFKEEEKGEVSRKRERKIHNDDSSLKGDQVVPVRMVKPRM